MSYSPADTIKDPEVYRELQRIGEEFNQILKLKITSQLPTKPRDGDVRIADGINWNPIGDGIKRPVWFDVVSHTWKSFT